MTDAQQRIIDEIILAEGGLRLVDIKYDRGGQTYAGISRRYWPHWDGWTLIDGGETPSQDMVRGFYLREFWSPMRLELIASQEAAGAIMDCAVLFGIGRAVIFAQRASGAVEDGNLGPKTAASVNAMQQPLFLAKMALIRIAEHTDTVARHKAQVKFYVGWVSRALDRSGIRWR